MESALHTITLKVAGVLIVPHIRAMKDSCIVHAELLKIQPMIRVVCAGIVMFITSLPLKETGFAGELLNEKIGCNSCPFDHIFGVY